MKKTLLVLILGLLIIASKLYAEDGDLFVTGKIGVGTDVPTAKLDVRGNVIFNEDGGDNDFRVEGQTVPKLFGLDASKDMVWIGNDIGMSVNTRFAIIGDNNRQLIEATNYLDDNFKNNSAFGLSVLSVRSGSEAVTGQTTNVKSSAYITTQNNIQHVESFLNTIEFASTGTGPYSAAGNMNNLRLRWVATNNTPRWNITSAASDIKSEGINADAGNDLNFTDLRHLWVSNSSAGTITNYYGIYIEKLTQGSNNHGIVLAGNEEGADIVFGPNQEARIFSKQEMFDSPTGIGIWVEDEFNNQTQISPHDPETGEWIFYSKNTKTGRTVRVNMEELVRDIEKITGKKYLIESFVETSPVD